MQGKGTCRAADGAAAGAAVRAGHDQEAGGGRGPAALDLLPHLQGDWDHGVSVEWGDARTRAADRRARIPEDDEALRPDGGHDHRRRDRAHRDLATAPMRAVPRARPAVLRTRQSPTEHWQAAEGSRVGRLWAPLIACGLVHAHRKAGYRMPDWKRDLKRGQLYRFRDWPQVRRDVPTKPGVYTIWDQEGRFIYVGIATERRGLCARLAEHANGGRGGDRSTSLIVFSCRASRRSRSSRDSHARRLARRQLGARCEPAAAVREGQHVVTKGATPVLSPAEARRLI